jgi:hypothetical protein
MKKKNVIIAGIASLVVVATTAFLLVRKRTKQKDSLPPKNAPQVPINNPGDQSDFPAGPTGEAELG